MKSMKFVKSYEIGAGTTNTYAPVACASTKGTGTLRLPHER